jgi:menaquinone-dependent protoporphyrinogen oxidase
LKILILYASTHGATRLCAEKLALALGSETEAIDVNDFFGSPAEYDGTIIGTPVYGGRILKEIKAYCKENMSILLQKPFAVFFSCLSERETTVNEYLKQNFPPELAEHAAACESLGGAFYFKKLNPLERAVDKKVASIYAKSSGIPAPDGKSDFSTISYERINAFAQKINGAFGKAS